MKPPLKKSAPSKPFCSMCHVSRKNGDRLWRSKQCTPQQHGRERNSVGRQKAGISLSRLNWGHKKAHTSNSREHRVWDLCRIKVTLENFGHWCMCVSDFWGSQVYNQGVCAVILILTPHSAVHKDLLTASLPSSAACWHPRMLLSLWCHRQPSALPWHCLWANSLPAPQ